MRRQASTNRFEDLRRRAESLLRDAASGATDRAFDELADLSHELQLSYTELEVQNEDLREAQARAIAAEAEFRDLFELAPVAHLTLDDAGRVMRRNEIARQWFGEPANSQESEFFFTFVGRAHRGAFGALLKEARRAGRRCCLDMEIVGADGGERWVSVSMVSADRGPSGADTIMVSLTDIDDLKKAQRELRRSEARHRTVVESLHDSLCILDVDGHIVEANPAASRLFGKRRPYLQGEPIQTMATTGSGDLLLAMRAGIRVDGRFQGTALVARPDGGRTNVAVSCITFLYNGAPHILAVLRDIEHQMAAERMQRQASVVFEQSTEGIMVVGADHRIMLGNRAASEITGHLRHELTGVDFFDLLAGHDPDTRAELREALGGDGRWSGEITARRRDGAVYTAWLSISRIDGGGAEPRRFVAMLHDVTEHRRAERRIRQLAHYDVLTDLPNRALFTDRLDHAIRHARRADSLAALLVIDLDNFKSINDSLGHLAGDAVLREVAERLRRSVREEDTVARMGGDEFMVLLGDLPDGATARRVTARLCRCVLAELERPVQHDGRDLFTGGSIGVAMLPDDAATAEDLVRCADTAMYAAKRAGRGRFQFFSADMDTEARRRHDLETGLRQALETGGLVLHYQPEVAAADGAPVATEALLRWPRPDGRLMPPAELIGMAEETGFMVPLGRWILDEACRQRRQWLDEGLDTGRMAVNVSPRQVNAADFVATVRQALADHDLPPDLLEIEVSERVFLGDVEATAAVLQNLRDLGITVVIDDFGTGFSSLGYLKRLPVDKLKIDRSFIADLAGDEDDQAIVSAVIDLGRRFGLTVLAEGVEREEQAAWLRAHGCHQLHGFLFGRPEPAVSRRVAEA